MVDTRSQLDGVQLIPAERTYAIRHRVLRAGFPPETARFDSDFEPNSFHLGAYSGDVLVGTASYAKRRSNHFFARAQYQLRGMALLPAHQGQGWGKLLLERAYPLIMASGTRLLWCNARTSALGFYAKLGFETIGEEFQTPLAGPHYVMYRNLHN